MKILDTNDKFILALSQQLKLLLIDSLTLKVLHKREFEKKTIIKAASLQYGTGVAALAIGSKVHFYDFLYQREIDVIQTYKPIIKLCIRKNLLIVVSDDRVLIYNIQKKQNQCYIPILDGKLVFLEQNYYRLSIFYPEDHQILASKSIWQKNVFRNSSGLKYQRGCYFDGATKFVLALENTLSFYQQGEMLKVYGFDSDIIALRSTEDPKIVLVLLQSDEIVGQNLTEQWGFSFQKVDENPFIQSTCQDKKLVRQSQFWVTNREIYHWIKKQGQQGQLFRAKLNQGILKVDSNQLLHEKTYLQEQSLDNTQVQKHIERFQMPQN